MSTASGAQFAKALDDYYDTGGGGALRGSPRYLPTGRKDGVPLFDEYIIGGSQERHIRVETHRGTSIQNVIAPDVTDRQRRIYDLIRKRYGKSWQNRKCATGVYNCYGMVFASRRTAIIDDGQDVDQDLQLNRILSDDGYRKLADESEAKVGDVVVYRSQETNGVLHVAVVTRRESISLEDGRIDSRAVRGAVFALSKWNDFSGEDEHHVRQHCLGGAALDIAIELWTDRSEEK